jgi:hypothetical protein
VSGDEAAELMRLHREQVRIYDDIRTEPPEEGQKDVTRESRELTIEEFDEDVRGLVASPGDDLTVIVAARLMFTAVLAASLDGSLHVEGEGR